MPAMTEAAMVGKRQDIIDDIFNIESDKTPVLSMLKTGERPKGMLTSWVGEVYPSVPSVGVLDGTPATAPQKVDRYVIEAYCQHFRREWGVTNQAELTEAAGVGRNEAGHQMMLAMLLCKRMIEQRILSNEDMTAQSGATPYAMRGMFSWLQATAQTQKPVPEQVRPVGASRVTAALSAITENTVRTALEAAFNDRREAVDLFGVVGNLLKATIDDFTNVYPVASTTSQPRTVYQVRDSGTYQSMVDFLKFSVGNVKLMVSTFLAVTASTGAASAYTTRSGVLIDPDMWQWCWLGKPANTNLAPDGSGKKGFVDAYGILKCLNPKGQVSILTNT